MLCSTQTLTDNYKGISDTLWTIINLSIPTLKKVHCYQEEPPQGMDYRRSQHDLLFLPKRNLETSF